jgi:DNA-nicking Smr family endonuclease
MKLTDLDLWKEYTKSVSRIKNNNVVRRSSNKDAKETPIAYKPLEVDIQDFPRKAQVLLMSRGERRKFFEEARLDLHGSTQERASQILPSFCKRCILLEIRNVVIITGKGDGIIRQTTHDWLASSPLYVVNFHPIRDSRGESGAYAVRLRKI